jgi:hypothetical protein
MDCNRFERTIKIKHGVRENLEHMVLKLKNVRIIKSARRWQGVSMSERSMRGGTMATIKKCFCFIFVCCFLSAAPSVHVSLAAGGAAETNAGLQKGRDAKGNVSAQNIPHISFDAAEYDVGEVFEGAIVVHQFIVKNTGTAQLDISDVKPG